MPDITLPEITIVGDASSLPQNAADWFSQGFITGFNAPDATPDRPLMINDDLAGTFFQGVAAGQSAAKDAEAEFQTKFGDQQQIGPDVKSETLEHAQKRFREEFEGLFHEHMPHTENEEQENEPLPLPNIGLVE